MWDGSDWGYSTGVERVSNGELLRRNDTLRFLRVASTDATMGPTRTGLVVLWLDAQNHSGSVRRVEQWRCVCADPSERCWAILLRHLAGEPPERCIVRDAAVQRVVRAPTRRRSRRLLDGLNTDDIREFGAQPPGTTSLFSKHTSVPFHHACSTVQACS